jgi:hypothetical protein
MRHPCLLLTLLSSCADMTPAPPGPVVPAIYRVTVEFGDNGCGKEFWPVGDDRYAFTLRDDGRYDLRKADTRAYGWPVEFKGVAVNAGGRIDHRETWSYMYQGPPWPKTAVGIAGPETLELDVSLGWEDRAFQPCTQHARIFGRPEG